MKTKTGLYGAALAAVILGLIACGGSSSEVPPPGSGPDAGSGDAGTTTDSGSADTGGGADGGGSADGGGGFDAATGDLVVEVDVSTIFQNCMPIVAPDPLTVQGSLKIDNNGAAPAGPLVFKDATVYDAAGATKLATFSVDTTTQVIAARDKTTSVFEKQSASLAPQSGCAALSCNTEVVVELSFSGPGAPPGAKARAKPKKVNCAF